MLVASYDRGYPELNYRLERGREQEAYNFAHYKRNLRAAGMAAEPEKALERR